MSHNQWVDACNWELHPGLHRGAEDISIGYLQISVKIFRLHRGRVWLLVYDTMIIIAKQEQVAFEKNISGFWKCTIMSLSPSARKEWAKGPVNSSVYGCSGRFGKRCDHYVCFLFLVVVFSLRSLGPWSFRCRNYATFLLQKQTKSQSMHHDC